ncbi:MAG: site-specific DNA-methyltransferase [bacterium]
MSELDKKLMQTPDLNKERLVTLKTLFPDLFTVEGKLNPDELKKIIDPDLVKETERFEFKWFGKSEAKRNAFTPSKATLVYDEKKSVNPDYADGNMIIEGENLETLKCLLSGYRERVKCIYIDPPYNVDGDFVYNDTWDESKENYWEHIGITQEGCIIDTNSESNGRFHSNWLNMLLPRLLVARQLLQSDGAIFVSIGDEEYHNMRKLLDDVFGEENYRNTISTRRYDKNINRQFIENGLASFNVGFEYIICYSKSSEFKFNPIYREASEDRQNYGYWKGFWNNANRPTMRYDILGFKPETGQWKWSEGRAKIAVDNYLKYQKECGENESLEDYWVRTGKKLEFIRRNTDGKGMNKGVEHWIPPTTGILRNTNWYDFFASKSTEEISDLFDFPKNPDVIKSLIQMCEYNGDIILDFFAGSGSTGQAVMELNKNDGLERKVILVQLPELLTDKTDTGKKAISAGFLKISDITIERNKRVIQKIEKEEADKQRTLLDDKKPFKTGFKVYKLGKSNFPRIDFAPDPSKTEEENLALLDKYIEEKEAMFLSMIDEKNIFDEVLLKNGFMLNYSKTQEASFTKNKVYRIKDSFKECLICMDMAIDKHTLNDLEAHKDTIFICLERSLDTTMKWNLKHLLGDKLIAF